MVKAFVAGVDASAQPKSRLRCLAERLKLPLPLAALTVLGLYAPWLRQAASGLRDLVIFRSVIEFDHERMRLERPDRRC